MNAGGRIWSSSNTIFCGNEAGRTPVRPRGAAFMDGKEGPCRWHTWSCICLGRSTGTRARGVKVQGGFSAKKALSWENPLAMRLPRMGGEPTLRKAWCLISRPAFFLRADLCQAYGQFKGTHTSKTSSESCTISSRLRIHTRRRDI